MSDANLSLSPARMEDGWPVARPDEHGLDPTVLAGIGPRFEAWTDAVMHAILIARDGTLVYERYFAGEDHRWGVGPVGRVAYDTSMRHDLRSITKSVTSLLMGIAVDRGDIKDIGMSVFSFFPEHGDLRTREKDGITLRHLLTMSAGLAWNEIVSWSNPECSEKLMQLAPDLYRYVLEQPLVNQPGRVFNYCGGGTELLGAILCKTSGKPLDAQAREDLFDPLGIRDVQWLHYPNGDPAAASGLRLRNPPARRLTATDRSSTAISGGSGALSSTVARSAGSGDSASAANGSSSCPT